MLVSLQVQRPICRAIHPVLFQQKNEHGVVAIDQQEFPETSTAFGVVDAHDVRIGDHQHSVSFPEDGHTINKGDRLYQTKDSTVTVWKMKSL